LSDVVAHGGVESAAPVSTDEATNPRPPGGDSAPSAPQSTADITANVVRSAESADREESAITDAADDDTTRAAATEVAAEVAPPKPAVAIKDLSIEEQLLHEFGFKDLRKPDGREHYIPRSKVLQMIGSGLKRGEARWEGERTAIEATAKTAQADLHELITDLRGDPKAFLSKVAQHDPRYRAFLEPQAAPQQQRPTIDERPGPDIDLGNGQRTYSPTGCGKPVGVEAPQVIQESLKPYEDRFKAEDQRVEAAKVQDAIHGRVKTQLDEAATWPEWKDYEPEHHQALEDDTRQGAGRRQASVDDAARKPISRSASSA
jgi:hypothetical protein